MRRLLWVAGLLGALGVPSFAAAQPNVEALTKGSYKYAINQGAGTFVITLKGFKGQEAQALAEEFADYIRNSYGLSSYLLDLGTEMREAENQRINELKKQHAELVKQNGAENVAPLRYKTFKMEPQFAVFIGGPKGGWKEDETPLKILKELRKKPLPPEKFCDHVYTAMPGGGQGKGEAQAGSISPFTSGMVTRNPTLPKVKPEDDGKPDPFLKELNAGEEYSLLKTSKKYTLAVKFYSGQAVLRERGAETSTLEKLLGGGKTSLLNASAAQAHELARYLRSIKPSYDAYVLHYRSYSMVTVGNYDKADDPNLMEAQRTLANLRIGNVEQLNARIEVIEIPRP